MGKEPTKQIIGDASKTTTKNFKSKRTGINNPLKISKRDHATKQFMRSTTCINNHQFGSTLAWYFRMMRGLCLPDARHID